jgi:immunity protein 50 of polymorphic toxin system
MTVLDHITGADRLVERFGGWPSFHDAEVVRLALDRSGTNGPTAEMLVHAWLMTDKVDERGYYVLEKHTLVRFVFERIASIELSEFNHQNVLFGLEVAPETVDGEPAFRVALDPSYGLGGSLVCGRVVVADVTPCDERGEPAGEG